MQSLASTTRPFPWCSFLDGESRGFVYFGGGAAKDDRFGFGGVPAAGNRDLGSMTNMGLTWKPWGMLNIYASYSHGFGGNIPRDSCVNVHVNVGFLETTWSF